MFEQIVTVIILLLYFQLNKAYSQNESKACPVWMEYNKDALQCQCKVYRAKICNNNALTLQENFCVSFDNQTQRLLTGFCPYSYSQEIYSKKLNSSVTYDQLNEVMCGPLKREGLFCSKCKPGYGIPVFSKDVDECVKCGSKLNWLLYFALELTPLTFFYILVIIFNFSATHPPITAYIFYCQLLTQLADNMHFVRHFFKIHSNKVFLYLTWTITDVWNLDVLRYVIPGFCLSSKLSNVDALFIELITAFYSIFLTALTFFLIEMHAHNFRLIVCIWKPFHKCFASFRRNWDPRSSVVNAFATFLLLSSFKICFLAWTLLCRIHLYTEKITLSVLYIDPTVNLRQIFKQAYFVPTLILLTVFVMLPFFLLCLYPTKLCKSATRCVCTGRQRNAIFLFMECFQGYYKNGTADTYDYRFASCTGFLLRLLVCFSLSLNKSRFVLSKNGPLSFIIVLLIATSLFYAHVQPCKMRYMNVVESLLYSIAAVLLMCIINNNKYPQLFNCILVMILMPSVIFVGVILYKVLQVLGIVQKISSAIKKLRGVGDDNTTIDNEPHRLTNPSQYTSLIQ